MKKPHRCKSGRRDPRTERRRASSEALPGVIVLDAAELRRVLDPQTFKSDVLLTPWLQCRNAAAAAIMACCYTSAEEIAALQADDYIRGRDAAIHVRYHQVEFANRQVPLIDAARCVLQRYLEALPAELQGSKYLFVQPDGRPMLAHGLLRSIQAAGWRLELTYDLPASLKATFRAAVERDPIRDGAAERLLKLKPRRYGVDATAKPPMTRLQQLLRDHHPLAPYGRIRYFESATPTPPLVREILACSETRSRDPREIQRLRVSVFPEVVRLWEAGLVTQGQAARWFGVHRDSVRTWIRQFKARGLRGLRGYNTERLTPEWRLRVAEAYAAAAPVHNVSAFHRDVQAQGFGYCVRTLRNFLKHQELLAPAKRRRKCMASAPDLTSDPPPPCAICIFSQPDEALRRHLAEFRAGSPEGRLAWRQVLAREARRRRPERNETFYSAMVEELGYPRSPRTMHATLKEADILLSHLRRAAKPIGNADPLCEAPPTCTICTSRMQTTS